MSKLLSTLTRLLTIVRDAWLIIGISLALLLVTEIGYRTQGALRRWIRSAITSQPAHPQAKTPWFDEYTRESEAAYKLRWKPYVYFRRQPFSGRYINVDDRGLRRTVAPEPAGDGAREVYMFGGSTMFGSYQRDAKTLPSLVAEALAPAGSVRVLNFGETGYVFTQEVLELMLQLRSGARPRVVLFYDGINDVASAVQNGVAGIPQNERNRERDFQLGLTAFSWRRDIGAELRALGSVVEIASYRSALSQRVFRLVRRQQWEGPDPEELAPRVIDTYVDTARLVETLANAYNFQAIYVWQPTLHSTDKRLTTYESTLMGAIDADPYHVKMKAVHGLVSRSIDHAMAGVASGRFLNLSALFAGEGAPVFVDEIGHTTEEANKPLVEAMLPLLRAALTDLPPRSQGGRQGEK